HGPTRMTDQFLCFIAVALIRLYQTIGRRLHRRTCLFHPTCSCRAVASFQTYSFREALNRTRVQLRECQGDYSLRTNAVGQVELITAHGNVVPEDEMNPAIASRMTWFKGPFIGDENQNFPTIC